MLFSGLCGVCYGVPVLVGEMRERECVCWGWCVGSKNEAEEMQPVFMM